MQRIIKFLILQGVAFMVTPHLIGKKYEPIIHFTTEDLTVAVNIYERILKNGKKGYILALTKLESENRDHVELCGNTQLEINAKLKTLLDNTKAKTEIKS